MVTIIAFGGIMLIMFTEITVKNTSVNGGNSGGLNERQRRQAK